MSYASVLTDLCLFAFRAELHVGACSSSQLSPLCSSSLLSWIVPSRGLHDLAYTRSNSVNAV